MPPTLPDQPVPRFLCCDFSRQAGEAMPGTAPRVDVWFLLEYAGRWEAKALNQSALPEAVKARLSGRLEGIPHTRTLLIRQGRDPSRQGVAFFVAVADEVAPRLYAFPLERVEEVLDLDLPAIAAGEARYEAFRRAEPLFLTCTNGRRDASCARYGPPVYREMARQAGEAAWQSTHLSGHRFAATALFLPHGLYYGRVAVAEVPALVAAYRQGQVVLSHFRGRSCHGDVVQAAEYFLRRQTGIVELPGFRLVEARQAQGQEWLVRFLGLADGRLHETRLLVEPTALAVYLSSRDSEPSPVPQYRWLGHRVVAGAGSSAT